MALSANTVWEVRPGGNDTNGGGFVAGASGTDWSQQAAPQYSVTDAVANGTTTVTSATANFGTDVVGNIAYIGGAWYEITARASATSITVDRTITAASGLTIKIGGALASPGQAGACVAASNTVFVKAGTYTISAATANVSGGCVQLAQTNDNNNVMHWVGYNTNRTLVNNDSTMPTLQVAASGVTSTTILNVSGERIRVRNFTIDGQSKTSIRGLTISGNYSFAVNVIALNCTNSGLVVSAQHGLLVGGRAEGCSTQPAILLGSASSRAWWCVARNNPSVAGFRVGSVGCQLHFCLSDGNSVGFALETVALVFHCTAYGSSSHGFAITGAANALTVLINCISYGNGGWGFDTTTTGTDGILVQSCAAGSNTSGNFDTFDLLVDEITLTADPFTNAAGGDFSLNDAAGGGALLKGTGYPQTMPVV